MALFHIKRGGLIKVKITVVYYQTFSLSLDFFVENLNPFGFLNFEGLLQIDK
jgi:hypothetical protein